MTTRDVWKLRQERLRANYGGDAANFRCAPLAASQSGSLRTAGEDAGARWARDDGNGSRAALGEGPQHGQRSGPPARAALGTPDTGSARDLHHGQRSQERRASQPVDSAHCIGPPVLRVQSLESL